MFEVMTTILICNAGRDLSCLKKSLDSFPTSKVIFVCEKRGECVQKRIKDVE